MYALVRPYIPKLPSNIIVPETVSTQISELTHYELIQLGQKAAEHSRASIGKRVLLERMMVHHFSLDNAEYGFLPADRILAEVEGPVEIGQAGPSRVSDPSEKSSIILSK